MTSPTPYVGWAALVSAALFATYLADPYVFGFTTLGLAWLTAPVAVAGLGACLFSKRPRSRDRAIIVGALVLAASAIAAAFAALGTFNWA